VGQYAAIYQMSDTLTITDVAHTASVSLTGQYSAADFSSADDGNGGTIIGETLAAATEPAALAVPHYG
jgi:trimeric autotransporter adhesin